MVFPSYQEFLEEIICQLKDKVKGQIELRHNDYGELMCRYDIMVKFNCDLTVCVTCDLGGEVYKLYYNYEHTPEMDKYTIPAEEMAKYAIRAGTMQVLKFIEKAVFDYFFQIA